MMKAHMEKDEEVLKKIGKTTFFKSFLKDQGFKYKRQKMRFGMSLLALKEKCRPLNSALLYELIMKQEHVYFYDESIIMMTGFSKKNWVHVRSTERTILRRSNIFIKLNVVVCKEGIVSFQLCDAKHNQEDTAKFIATSISFIRQKIPSNVLPVLVLDNSPKNRSKKLFTMANSDFLLPFFIVPGAPEQNFSETVFGAIKKKLFRLEVLEHINDSAFIFKSFVGETLLAMSQVSQKDFHACWKLFLHELKISAFKLSLR